MQSIADIINYHNEEPEYLAFLETRKTYDLTSSEFASALGLDKYNSRQKLWRRKTNMRLETELEPSIFSEFNCNYGSLNEDNGVKRFAEKVPLFTIKKSTILPIDCGPIIIGNRQTSYKLGSSPDRTLHNKVTDEIEATLEVKCPAPLVGFYGKTTREAMVYPLAQQGQVPIHHLLQIIGQMKATKVSQAYYQVWTPNNGDATIHVAVSQSFWHHVWDQVIVKELYIFLDLVRDRVKPGKRKACEKKDLTQLIYQNVNMKLV